MAYSIGITAWSLPSPGTHSLALARELGFDAIQLDLGNYDHCLTYAHPRFRRLVLDEARALELRILPLTLNALGGHPFVNGLDTEDGRIALRIIDAGIEAAADMGLEGVAVPSFGRNDIHTAAHLDATIEGLRYACGKAAEAGLLVYTENVLSPEELRVVFDRCGCGNLRLLFDSQNYSAMGHDHALAVLDAFRDRLGSYVHVKDGTTVFGSMPLGEGWSPLPELCAVLKEISFDGAIVLENNYDAPPLCREPESDVFDTIARDMAALRALMGQ